MFISVKERRSDSPCLEQGKEGGQVPLSYLLLSTSSTLKISSSSVISEAIVKCLPSCARRRKMEKAQQSGLKLSPNPETRGGEGAKGRSAEKVSS